MGGKNRKFLEYYNKYKDKIFNYIWYRVNFNQALADDLTSEIFIKAYEKYDTFDEARPFQSWIYAIAKNHLLNYYRTANRETDLLSAYKLSGNDLEKLDAVLELKRIISLINRMHPSQRDILLLRFADGLDNKEIAQILCKDEGAVRVQISRALKELRELSGE